MARLEADLAGRPDDTTRKYRLAFARGTGVAWAKDRTFNARHHLAVADVAAWLRVRGEAMGPQ